MSNLIQDLIRDGDLAAWYDFRSGTVDDLSGNGRDCTIVGTPHFNREGLSFSDLSSYLSLPLSAFPSSNSLTIVWFCTFTDANNNDWTRVLGSDDSGGGGYEMRTATDDVIMGYVSGTNQNSNGGGSVPTGVPFMGALTCDESGGSTTQKYYVDGVEKDSTVVASTVNTPDTSLWIGHFAADGLIGSVVSVLFIDRVLNITEIGNIMGETRAQRWPTKPMGRAYSKGLSGVPGLLKAWMMQPQGATVPEAVSGVGNGTIEGNLIHSKTPVGDALRFCGNNERIACGVGQLLPAAAFSTAILCQPLTRGEGNFGRFFEAGVSTYAAYIASATTGNLRYAGSGGGTNLGFTGLLLGQWTLLLVTYDGTTINIYSNGELVGSAVDTVTLDAAQPLFIGNPNTGNRAFDGPIAYLQHFDHALTEAERTRLYEHSLSAVQFKTDWGTPVTVPASVGAGAQLGPFMVDSGTHKITTDAIESKLCKVIECVTAGVVYMPVPSWEANQMGSWEFWVRKMDASRLSFMFTASAIGGIATPTNINVDFGTDESIKVKTGFTTILDGGTATAETWHKVKVTRRIDYTFELFVDDVSRGTGVNNPLLEGFYMNIEMDAGDKVALADVGGGHAILKRLGAVT